MSALDRLIEKQVREMVGPPSSEVEPNRPPGDEGLFGRGSMAWKVHGDFTTMMAGGISALLLQMLHQGALAGVWDHSEFRSDMFGRLRRTAQFIGGTTYGSTERALGLISRVRSVHDRVQGTMPDGTSYSANDPALLTWVHVAEMSSFLHAYIRYRAPGMAVAEQDRYFAEVAIIAERLGATEVPKTKQAVDAYLRRIRSELVYDHRTRIVAGALLSQRAPKLLAAPFLKLVMDAGIDLLPDWAAEMHRLRLGIPRVVAARAGIVGIGAVVRRALRPRPATVSTGTRPRIDR
jgi:uncharacterized protein (DUF2236 family)